MSESLRNISENGFAAFKILSDKVGYLNSSLLIPHSSF